MTARYTITSQCGTLPHDRKVHHIALWYITTSQQRTLHYSSVVHYHMTARYTTSQRYTLPHHSVLHHHMTAQYTIRSQRGTLPHHSTVPHIAALYTTTAHDDGAMLKRPSSSDSEADLLRAQECFLAAGVPSAVRVLRRPEKRRGEPSGCAGEEKAEEEEEVMEHDTSAVPVSFPAFTGAAFPKVFHRSEVEDQGITVAQKCRKSIFAQKIAAQKIAAQRARGKGLTGGDPVQPTLVPQGTSCAPLASMETASLPSGSEEHAVSETSRLVTGLGLSGHNGSLEAKKIHEENEAKLHGMSQSEILEEQRRLLSQLEPRLVDFVKSRKPHGGCQPSAAPLPAKEEQQHCFSEHISQEVEMEDVEANVAPAPPITEDELPVKPEKGWLHMDKLEPEKLEWMRDLPASRKRSTKKAMQARFNFDGVLISPTEDLPTHLGLHHHGDEPELAGYSLQELFLLSRSQVTQQRCLALTTLGHILTKARASDFASSVRGSVFATLLDAGLLFLLRFSLDDKYEGLMAAAVQALRALLVTVDDEECLDNTFSWFLGMATFPLLPFAQEEDKEDDEGLEDALKETAKEKEEKKSDHDVARNDVIKGLLRMKLLPRLRYILEVLRPPPRTVLDILEILIRIARHSPTSAIQVWRVCVAEPPTV
ncbi:hypothetical protein Z043_119770 [Scleropages formosus]|uniref:RNA polymerase II-associated protein 1-like n=1 Tax=Scleropages formosus TaxID=113540 RepID=A0A0P7TWF5_SCLFO|nr:hypothetical protein Z043_119770 [Scleropages formosus]